MVENQVFKMPHLLKEREAFLQKIGITPAIDDFKLSAKGLEIDIELIEAAALNLYTAARIKGYHKRHSMSLITPGTIALLVYNGDLGGTRDKVAKMIDYNFGNGHAKNNGIVTTSTQKLRDIIYETFEGSQLELNLKNIIDLYMNLGMYPQYSSFDFIKGIKQDFSENNLLTLVNLGIMNMCLTPDKNSYRITIFGTHRDKGLFEKITLPYLENTFGITVNTTDQGISYKSKNFHQYCSSVLGFDTGLVDRELLDVSTLDDYQKEAFLYGILARKIRFQNSRKNPTIKISMKRNKNLLEQISDLSDKLDYHPRFDKRNGIVRYPVNDLKRILNSTLFENIKFDYEVFGGFINPYQVKTIKNHYEKIGQNIPVI